MFGSGELSFSVLSAWSRVLQHNLGAGIALRRIFHQLTERGPHQGRTTASAILEHLDRGDNLETALDEHRKAFPPLFRSLVTVGEQTGNLAEIFAELERYYDLQIRMRRQVIAQSIMPATQLALAFLIIALLIFVLGMIAGARGTAPISLFGLQGTTGALTFLLGSFGSLFLIFLLYRLASRNLKQRASVDRFLLRIPGLGPCLEALAVSRFALVLRLTMESALPIARALRLSFEGSGNAAYAAAAPLAIETVKAGQPLLTALENAEILPEPFLEMVASAEEGGKIPEMMKHQADYYQEEGTRRLTVFTRMLGLGVWMLYAVFMIIVIFRIAGIYFAALG